MLHSLQRQEAINRLKMLEKQGFHNHVRMAFEKNGELYYSSPSSSFGHPVAALRQLSKVPEYLDVVQEAMERYGGLAYHCIETESKCGKMLSILYVTSDPRTWHEEREVLLYKIPFAFVHNFDKQLDEIGGIEFEVAMGGLLRTR